MQAFTTHQGRMLPLDRATLDHLIHTLTKLIPVPDGEPT